MADITQTGRVLVCGSKSHRFNSYYSPRIRILKSFKALNEFLNIKTISGRLITKS